MFKKRRLLEFIIFGLIILSLPVHAEDTSLLMSKLDFDDFSFASTNFVTDGTIIFNTSIDSIFSYMNSMNVMRSAGSGDSIVIGRIILDSVEILEQELITVSTNNEEGVAAFKPVEVNLSAGEHNITLQFRRTGTGSININDIDFISLRGVSIHQLITRMQVNQFDYTHSSTDFENAFNWTMNKTITSSTFIGIQQTATKGTTGSSVLTYFQNNTETGEQSPFTQRELPNANAIASISFGYVDVDFAGEHNHTILARQTDVGDIIIVNGSIIDFDLVDSNNNTIQSFQATNDSTNTTETLSLPAGIHLIVSATLNITNGTSMFLAAGASIDTESGAQEAAIFVNSTGSPESVCFSKKERIMPVTGGARNLAIFTTCNNLTVNENDTFQLFLNISSGETITLLDESLSGFEGTSFATEQLIIPPTDTELLLDCLRDGNCDGWFIKERVENILLLLVYFTVLILAIKWSGGDQD